MAICLWCGSEPDTKVGINALVRHRHTRKLIQAA